MQTQGFSRRNRSGTGSLCGRPVGLKPGLSRFSGSADHVQSLTQNGHMVCGILDVCNGFLDLAAERFDGAGSSLGNGRIGIRGLLGGFQSIGIFFCDLGGFLLSNYIFTRCDEPQGKLYQAKPPVENNPELAKFVEMCLDPESPMHDRLKATLIEMVTGKSDDWHPNQKLERGSRIDECCNLRAFLKSQPDRTIH